MPEPTNSEQWPSLTRAPTKLSPPESSTTIDPKPIAERIWEKRPGIAVDLRNALDHATIDYQKLPTEVDRFLAISETYGLTSGRYQDEGRQKIIARCFYTLRPTINGPSGWSSERVDTTDNSHSLTDRLKDLYPQKNGPIFSTPEQFDTAVIVALSCGQPLTALGLIAKSPELVGTTADSSLSRLRTSLQATRQIYQPVDSSHYDAVLASLGEGPLSGIDLENSPVAKELKQQAETAILQSVEADISRRYSNQEIAEIKPLLQNLGPDKITQLISEYATAGKTKDELLSEIKLRSRSLVDAQIANLIAAELDRRLHPENTPETKAPLRRLFGFNKSSVDPDSGYVNTANNFYAFSRASAAERTKAEIIGSLPSLTDQDLDSLIVSPNSLDVNILIKFIKNPDRFGYERTYRERTLSITSDRKESQFRHRLPELAKKLVGSISFLEAVASTEYGQQLLGREFGLSYFADGGSFEIKTAHEWLKIIFNEKLSESDQTTIYEQAAGEVSEQYAVDVDAMAQIIKSVDNRTDQIAHPVVDSIGQITQKLASETQAEIATAQSKLSERNQLQSQLLTLEQNAEKVALALEQAAKLPVKANFLQRSRLTASEKETKLGELNQQQADIQKQITDINTRLKDYSNLSKNQLNALQQRLTLLQSYSQPTT